jgi:hypothetical protein
MVGFQRGQKWMPKVRGGQKSQNGHKVQGPKGQEGTSADRRTEGQKNRKQNFRKYQQNHRLEGIDQKLRTRNRKGQKEGK